MLLKKKGDNITSKVCDKCKIKTNVLIENSKSGDKIFLCEPCNDRKELIEDLKCDELCFIQLKEDIKEDVKAVMKRKSCGNCYKR